MASTYTDRIQGTASSTALKAPVVVATTGNITLSGLQTINGVAVVAEDRVLVKSQTNAVNNGIWIASADAWTRALDFNGARDVVEGTRVYVTGGSVNPQTTWVLTTDTPVIGASSMNFTISDSFILSNEAGIRPILSPLMADAQSNTDLIQGALTEAQALWAADGIVRTVYIDPDFEVPIVPPILWPNADPANRGNLIWRGSPGTVLRPTAGDTIGFFQPDDRTAYVENIEVYDLTVEAYINPDEYEQDDQNGGTIVHPGGTVPFNGSVWTGRFKNCYLARIRAPNYFDDQAFIYGVHTCTVVDPYWFCDDTVSSTGGHRLFEAVDSMIYNASGTSPDDGQQFCPVDEPSAVYFDLNCRNSYYIGGHVVSTVGRAMVIISDDNCTKSIINCGFIGVQGRGGGGQIRVLAFGAGSIINPVFSDIMLDGSDAILTPYGQRFEIRMSGDIRNPQMKIIEHGLQATFFQIQDWTGVVTGLTERPSGGMIDIKASPPALDEIPDDDAVLQTFNVAEFNQWDNGRLRITVAGSQLDDAIYINDCENLTIEVADISQTPVGFAHIKQHNSTVGTRILGGNLTGAGSNFSLSSVADEDFIYTDLKNAGDLILPRDVQSLDSLTNPAGPRPVSASTAGTWPALSATPSSGVLDVSRESVTQFRQRLNLRTGNLSFERWYNGSSFSTWKATRPVLFSATYDPISLADGEGVTTTIAATGAVLSDYVQVSHSLSPQGITVTGWVSAVDTVSVRFQNETGGVLDIASGTLRVGVTNS